MTRMPPSHPVPSAERHLDRHDLGHGAGLRPVVPNETLRLAFAPWSSSPCSPPLSLRHSPAQIEPGRRVADGIRLRGAVRAAGGREQRFARDPLPKRDLLLPQHRASRGIQGEKSSVVRDGEDSIAACVPARIHEAAAGRQRVQPSARDRAERVRRARARCGRAPSGTGNGSGSGSATGPLQPVTPRASAPVPSIFIRPTSRRPPSARTKRS